MATNTKLSLAEYLTYAFICSYSDGKVSHISRESLMDLTGIKKADTITKHTNKLEELGLLKKHYKYSDKGNKVVEYHIKQLEAGYICISNEILHILKTNEIAFAIKLAALRLNGTNQILLSNNEIIKRLEIRKSSFYKYIDVLIQNNIVIKIQNGYIVNPEFFFTFKIKTKKAKELEATLIGMIDNGSTYSKIFKNAYINNYEGINNIEGFLEWCISGCPNTLKKKEEEKTYQKITFDF